MAGFNFIDPNSLPALLHRPPGLIPGPIQAPQLGPSPGFQPPPLMGAPQMPGMPGMPQQQAPGFNVQDGARMLMAGLGAWRPPGQQQAPTPLDPAVMPSTSSIDRAIDPSLGTPQPDFLGGMPQWAQASGFPPDLWNELFGPGGGSG
jgi:hypothetical protein